MKQFNKIAFGMVASIALAGASVLPALAWSDNTSKGRPSYTIQEIEAGKLGDKIVLNSISNNQAIGGDEKDFVGARENTGNNSAKTNIWKNQINVEEGKTYLVRLYVHNNNPKGEKAVAKDVTTAFNIKNDYRKTHKIGGFITSSNATPTDYYDHVEFKSNRGFRLEYVKGSARLENNGIGAVAGGYQLSDDIATKGAKIGYKALDGNVPGCFEYANYVGIQVKPVFTDKTFDMRKEARSLGQTQWFENVYAKVGDKVEFKVSYRNLANKQVKDVMIQDSLPNNLKLVKGTTKLFNAANQKGIVRPDDIATKGINIGGYADNGHAYVSFTAEVVDDSLVCGTNKLINHAKVTADGKVLIDTANIFVVKACNKPTPQPVIPKTGPESAILTALGLGGLTTALGLYLASRKQ